MGAAEDLLETAVGELEVTLAQAHDAGDVRRLRDGLAAWMVEQGIEQWRPGEMPLEWIEACVAQGWVHVVRAEETLVASVTVVWVAGTLGEARRCSRTIAPRQGVTRDKARSPLPGRWQHGAGWDQNSKPEAADDLRC